MVNKGNEGTSPRLAGRYPDYPDNHYARASENGLALLDELGLSPRRRKRLKREIAPHIKHGRFSRAVECHLEHDKPELSELDGDEIERLLVKHADIARGEA